MGLIDNRLDTTTIKDLDGSKVVNAKSYGYDPTLGTVSAGTDTVSGQLDAMLGKDSSYINRARAGATQYANSRGLVNSLMAAGAGEGAAIDAAMPIASQDASTYSTQRLTNQAAGNQASQFGANAANTAGQFNASEGNRFGIIGAETKAEQELIGTRAGATSQLQKEASEQAGTLQEQKNTGESQLQKERSEQAGTLQEQKIAGEQALQELRGNQATGLAQIEADYKTLLQASDSAKTLFATQTQAMTAIMADPNTTPEQKQAGVERLSKILKAGLTIIGGAGDIDLVGLLDFKPPK